MLESHNGTLCSNEKELSTIMYNNTDKSHKTVHLYKVQNQVKIICAVRSKDSGYPEGRIVTGKGA